MLEHDPHARLGQQHDQQAVAQVLAGAQQNRDLLGAESLRQLSAVAQPDRATSHTRERPPTPSRNGL